MGKETVQRVLTTLSSVANFLDNLVQILCAAMDAAGQQWMLSTFNAILEGRCDFPEEWKEGRVSMIEKSNSVKGDLRTYRPITVSTRETAFSEKCRTGFVRREEQRTACLS